jgi:hypothetical protein
MLPFKRDEVGGILVHWHQDTFGCQVTDYIDAELGDISDMRQQSNPDSIDGTEDQFFHQPSLIQGLP